MASASKRSATDNNDIAPRPIKVTKKFPEDYTESRVVYFGPNGGVGNVTLSGQATPAITTLESNPCSDGQQLDPKAEDKRYR